MSQFFTENGAVRRRSIPLRFTRGFLRPAISELKNALHVVETNAPINEKQGDLEQAELERKNARVFKKAIGVLHTVDRKLKG